MRAIQYTQYGDPDVLMVAEVDEPHTGPGQIRICVHAASVNPIEWKTRAGQLAAMMPVQFPVTPGSDAAGVVDEVGDGVDGVSVADAVLGSGSGTFAEYAVLEHWAHKPDAVSFQVAAALPMAVETAARVLSHVGLAPGATVVVDGAAGGVGSALVLLAVERGLTVIGTASEANHDYLRTLGATPTTYGPGLADRVAHLTDAPVAAAFDLAGAGSVPELVGLTGDPASVVTIADPSAGGLGAVVEMGMGEHAWEVLQDAADLAAQGRFPVAVTEYPTLEDAVRAHARSESGHVRGKLVVTIAG
jgi:NADPH:quinone reductase-like Zn-dependent oxidoreductase